MAKIQLKGVEPSSRAKVHGKAFGEPKPGANLSWFYGTDYATNYTPYLIKGVKWVDVNTLQFRGVNLLNPKDDFGPDEHTPHYEVDLRLSDNVYRRAPSSLDALEPGKEKQYAILFLSADFVAVKDPLNRLSAAAGDPKYPQVAAEERDDLKKAHDELKLRYDEVTAINAELADELKQFTATTATLQSPKLQQWLKRFSR